MSGERPWWFLTAAFVVPGSVAVYAILLVVDRVTSVPGPVESAIALGGVAVPITDLARREDRWRDSVRPREIARWGPAGEWPPRRLLWRWPVTIGATAIASGLITAAGTILYQPGWFVLLPAFAAVTAGLTAIGARYLWRTPVSQ